MFLLFFFFFCEVRWLFRPMVVGGEQMHLEDSTGDAYPGDELNTGCVLMIEHRKTAPSSHQPRNAAASTVAGLRLVPTRRSHADVPALSSLKYARR